MDKILRFLVILELGFSWMYLCRLVSSCLSTVFMCILVIGLSGSRLTRASWRYACLI